MKIKIKRIKLVKPVWWWIFGICGFAAMVCLFCYALIPNTPWCITIERKDFVTALIAFGGIMGVIGSIIQTQKRISQQEKQQRDARFASGVELLGNPHESTRIGGAYSLYYLARDYAEYRTTVCEIICAHLRTIANKNKLQIEEYPENRMLKEPDKYPQNEVATIINLLFNQKTDMDSIFINERKKLNFVRLQFDSYISFEEKILTNTSFWGAELDYMSFKNAKLIEVDFQSSRLAYAKFDNADFISVDFGGAELENNHPKRNSENTGATFTGTRLADYSLKQIIEKGFSLKETMPNIQTKQTATP